MDNTEGKKIGVKKMKLLKTSFMVWGISLMGLGVFSNTSQAANLNNSLATSSAKNVTKTELISQKPNSSQGGQVVESGKYHLEFVPEQEANGTHLDFFLQQGDNHQAVPNAKVTAQVQAPDGTQKTLPLKYDAEGKHYTALFPGKAPGQYQVRMTADIKGQKVNGRFNFKK